MKLSVQPRRKCGILFLIEVYEIAWSIFLNRVSSFPKTTGSRGVRVLLPGKNQRRVLAFVIERRSVRERALPGGPAHVHSHGLIRPCAGNVESLVAKGLHHPQQLRFSPFARQLCY